MGKRVTHVPLMVLLVDVKVPVDFFSFFSLIFTCYIRPFPPSRVHVFSLIIYHGGFCSQEELMRGCALGYEGWPLDWIAWDQAGMWYFCGAAPGRISCG